MFGFKKSSMEKYVIELQKISVRKFPAAIKMALNGSAYRTQQVAKDKTVPKSFILRNNFTRKGIIYTKAIGSNINTMVAYAGAVGGGADPKISGQQKREYLKYQEEGFDLKPKSKYNFLPTLDSRIAKDLHRSIASRYRKSEIMSLSFTNENKFFIGKNKKGTKILYQKFGKNKLRVLRILIDTAIKIKPRHWLKDAIISNKIMDSQFKKAARTIISEHKEF
jgi:hypothetical protein